MSSRIYFSIYNRGSNWNYSIKLLPRYYFTRYILCSSSLSLCIKNGCCIRNFCRLYPLISPANRPNSSPPMSKCPIFPNIPRSKYNFLSPTLLGVKRNASSIFRLPRCIHKMKRSVFIWISPIICSLNTVYFHLMGGFCLTAKRNLKSSHIFSSRVIRPNLTPRLPQPERNRNHYTP